jgi:membrane-associated phospholipid phosphatase
MSDELVAPGEVITFERLVQRISRLSVSRGQRAGSLLAQVEAVDQAVYVAVARTPTPGLDRGLRRLTQVADNGVLWLTVAGVLAAVGGRRGRRAAVDALCSLGVSSLVANLMIKPVAVRGRPTRDEGVAADRLVRMPTSRSFPSGHTASAFAFAAGATRELPFLAPGLYALAAAVGYSRVHTGVHFPLDVVSGATLGAVSGEVVSALVGTIRRRRSPH